MSPTEALPQPNANTPQTRVSMSTTSRTTTTRIAPRACNNGLPLKIKAKQPLAPDCCRSCTPRKSFSRRDLQMLEAGILAFQD